MRLSYPITLKLLTIALLAAVAPTDIININPAQGSTTGGGGGTVGSIINTGTPATGNVPAYTDTTGTNVAPFTALTLTSTNANLTGALGVGTTAVVGTTITLKGTTDDATAYLLKGLDVNGNIAAMMDNAGRLDLRQIGLGGGIMVLGNLSTSAFAGQRMGHYAFNGNENSSHPHTFAYIDSLATDISSNSLDSEINIRWMENVNGYPAGVYAYQQPNKVMRISGTGLEFPNDVILGTSPASSGRIRMPNNNYIAARNAANNADIIMANVSSDNGVYYGNGSSLLVFQTAGSTRAIINSTGILSSGSYANDLGAASFEFRKVHALYPTWGATTPSQITGDQNNYNPGGQGVYLRLSSDASRNITGLTFTSAQISGEVHTIVNSGSQNIVLVNESASSTAANRFHNATGADITLTADQQASIWYDGTLSRWRVGLITVTLANPSGTIGLTAVNGSATTAMRSDGAPALSQAIVPTWTGAHIFNAGSGVPMTIQPGAADTKSLVVQGGSVTGSGTTSLIDLSGTWNTSGSPTFIRGYVTNTASGASSLLMDLGVGTSTSRMNVDKNGNIIVSGPSTGTYFNAKNNSVNRIRFSDFTGTSAYMSLDQDNAVIQAGSSTDTFLQRSAAATWKVGQDASTATDQTIIAADGSGTDKTGDALTIGGGRSTGTGAPGKVLFKRGTVSTTGSSANAYGTSVSAGGTLDVNTTTTGNIGAGEDNLITYSIPAAQMSVNKDRIEFDCAGTFAATVNAKTLKVYFGATAIFNSSSLVLNGIGWRVHGTIIRTGAATQKATVEATIGGTLLSAVNSTITQYTTPAETLSGAVTFKCTGSDDGGVPADNAVVEELSVVKFNFAP